jgi:osmotically-inducible protein OsmY
MYPVKPFTTLASAVLLMTVLGCASTRTHEGTGEYVDDSVITTRVKTAIFNAPDLKSPEIKVHTFKRVVQLSGFVSSRHEIDGAMRVARTVGGVKAVTNEMQLK